MAAVLQFRNDMRRSRRGPGMAGAREFDPADMGQVIIFPGVRIERTDLDLSHRLVRVASKDGGASGTKAGKS